MLSKSQSNMEVQADFFYIILTYFSSNKLLTDLNIHTFFFFFLVLFVVLGLQPRSKNTKKTTLHPISKIGCLKIKQNHFIQILRVKVQLTDQCQNCTIHNLIHIPVSIVPTATGLTPFSSSAN